MLDTFFGEQVYGYEGKKFQTFFFLPQDTKEKQRLKGFEGIWAQNRYSCWFIEYVRCSSSPGNIRAAHNSRQQENLCFILGHC